MNHLQSSLISCVAGCLAAFAGPADAQYQIVATTSSQSANLVRTESTVVAGPAAIDRFKMIRLRRAEGGLKAAMLLLPSLGTNFTLYEQRDEHGGLGTSIAEFFALRGYDVWGYSPRYEGIPAGTCEAGVIDCSAMASWTLQSMVDDIAFVRSQIAAARPAAPVVTGGVSLGGVLAFAVANAHPADYVGIFPWEGMLSSDDPAVLGLNQGYCAGLTAQLQAGIFFDGITASVFRHFTNNARNTPQGLTPIPLFPPTLTNHQVMVAALSVPTPGPVSMPVPGYVAMAGSLPEDRLFFASEERLFRNVTTFNSYAPLALVRDVSCSLAGLDTQHVANLGNFTGSVLAIGGGLGFGPYMGHDVERTGSSDTTLLVTEEFAHIDHFMTPRHRDYVERPILDWLRRLFGP